MQTHHARFLYIKFSRRGPLLRSHHSIHSRWLSIGFVGVHVTTPVAELLGLNRIASVSRDVLRVNLDHDVYIYRV